MAGAEVPNEPGPKQGEMKMQDEVSRSYADIIAQEKAAQKKALEEKERDINEYNRFRNLGFATPADINTVVESKTAIMAELKKENEALRKDFEALKDFLLRAKARGQLNSGVLDDNGKSDDEALTPLQKYRRFQSW